MNIALRPLVLVLFGTAFLLMLLVAWVGEAVGDYARPARLR